MAAKPTDKKPAKPQAGAAPSVPHASRISPRLAVGVILAALVAWGGVLFWQVHRSPAQSHIDAGNEYVRQGKNLEAVQEWEAAAQSDRDNAYVWQVLGQSYFAANKWRRASAAFTQLQRLNPQSPHLYSLLASCAFHIGDEASALDLAQKELKRDPDDIPSLEIAVVVQTRRGNEVEQIQCLRRLVRLLPQNLDHQIALAEVLINDHDFAEGRDIAARIIQLTPDNPLGYVMHGICLFFVDGSPQGQSQAESDLQRALSLHPDNYFCHLYLGKIYRRQGQSQQARDHLLAATRLRADKADAYFDLASVYERMGQTQQAAQARHRFATLAQKAETLFHLKKQCELNPNDFDLNRKTGLMSLQQGDIKAAARYLQRAGALRPNDDATRSALERLRALNARSNHASELAEASLSSASEVK